jgi:hypothetical protein
MARVRSAPPWAVALLVTALALGWQWLIVEGYFAGQWSALFVAGDRMPQAPAAVAESTYLFPHSFGYDGQFYHAMAHDPLDLRGTDRYLDAPHIRYPRILLPALSYALGRLIGVDRAYRTLELMFLFLGVCCTGAWATGRGKSAWWAALFVLVPGVFISLERQLVDLPLCALLTAAILSLDRAIDRSCDKLGWLALACMGLVREMGLVAIAGFALADARERRFARAAAWLTAALPGVLWTAYVILHIPQKSTAVTTHIPILPILAALTHFRLYPFGAGLTLVLNVLDVVALAGLVLSYALGLTFGLRDKGKAIVSSTGLVLALFGIVASGAGIVDYDEAYSFARQAGPLLTVQLFQAIDTGSMILLLPLAMILPRSLALDASLSWRAVLGLLRQ